LVGHFFVPDGNNHVIFGGHGSPLTCVKLIPAMQGRLLARPFDEDQVTRRVIPRDTEGRDSVSMSVFLPMAAERGFAVSGFHCELIECQSLPIGLLEFVINFPNNG
jgi:hypothetical protein